MKILFDDILNDCVVSAVDTDSNFPVSNLGHPFLRRKWQSTSNTDIITIETQTAASITGVYLSYTNATSVSISVFGFDILGFTNDHPIGFGTQIIGFNAQASGQTINMDSGVYHGSVLFSKLEITVTAPVGTPVYVGKIAIGIDTELPPPSSFWDESFEDRSIVSVSDAGQVLQEFVQPLRIWQFDFPTIDRTDTRLLQDQYINTGVGKPVFVDPETDALPILYCRLFEPMSSSKNKRQYTTKLSLKEAR